MTTEKIAHYLYAISTLAFRGSEYGSHVMAGFAFNDEHAIGKGMVSAREQWPPENGWEGHRVGILRIPEIHIREAARILDLIDA